MFDFASLLTVDSLVSLLTLTLLEIVLGIDNIIFISILTEKLPAALQGKARKLGLSLALVFRILLLLSITWIIGLKEPLFYVSNFGVAGRDIILLLGGLFLIGKSTSEIHGKLEGDDEEEKKESKMSSFTKVLIQIILLDMVFSFDSILTAVGIVDNVLIMILAVIISMIVMISFSKYIVDFIHKHPTIKMLALSFLIMIGFLLVLEGLHQHVPKAYVYFAMAYALIVEALNIRLRKKSKKKPVEFREPTYTELGEKDK